jgi:hypothetical protein
VNNAVQVELVNIPNPIGTDPLTFKVWVMDDKVSGNRFRVKQAFTTSNTFGPKPTVAFNVFKVEA